MYVIWHVYTINFLIRASIDERFTRDPILRENPQGLPYSKFLDE